MQLLDKLDNLIFDWKISRDEKRRRQFREKLRAEDGFGALVERIQAINVQPDDVFIVTIRDHVSDEHFDLLRQNIKDSVKQLFPTNKFIVMHDVELSIYWPSENEPTK